MRGKQSLIWTAVLLLVSATLSPAQQPPVGVPVPPLGAGPWVIDTAEQHKIRLSVVTKGLSHPWAIAFLPDNTLLITGGTGRHLTARGSYRLKPGDVFLIRGATTHFE